MNKLLNYIISLCIISICLCSCSLTDSWDQTTTHEAVSYHQTQIQETEYSTEALASTTDTTILTHIETTTANTTVPETTKSPLSEYFENLTAVFPEQNHNFFDDVIFVGDSVTQGLKNRAVSERNKGKSFLGSAQFLCSGSLNFYSAAAPLSDSSAIHPTYKGKKVTVAEGIKLSGANKVFIMLGINDFSAFSDETWQTNISVTIDNILNLSPNIKIYIQSVTPIANGFEHGGFNNKNLNEFNEYLKKICNENGFVYVDINSVLADESGYLRREYCGDLGAMGIHMSNTGSDTWAKYLEDTFCK